MSSKDLLNKVTERLDLEESEAEEIASGIMSASIPEIVSAAFLSALKTKGESVSEISGFAKSMRSHALKVYLGDAIDTAGTGGDGYGTVNVSTISAILISQVYPVAKHGNRAASSKSGSADLLETLGYNINVTPERAKTLFDKHKFVFLFAQVYHPAMKNVANVRKTLGIRTIFNILGPLTNPAGVKKQMTGVFSKSYLEKIANAGLNLGYERLLLVHGEPGIDEVSPCGNTYVYELKGNKIDSYTVNYLEFIKEKISIDKLTVKDSKDSAIRILRAINNKDENIKNFVKMNSAFAIYTAGLTKDLYDGYELASQLFDTVYDKIYEIIEDNGDISKLKNLMVEAGVNKG
jgi:anthranilate phosphoribosyltransferase